MTLKSCSAVSLEHFERFTDDERLRILEWMSPIQYGKHHLAVKEKRTADTCEWLVQRDTFREWDTGNTFMILWLHGIRKFFFFFFLFFGTAPLLLPLPNHLDVTN